MSNHQLHNIKWIADKISSHTPKVLPPQDRGHASVAMILRQSEASPEVLFIIRAQHDNDPWSGNIGFPGGRINQGETPRQAAERETREELCLDLQGARFFGQLDDLYGAIMPVLVSCFVYYDTAGSPLCPNHEVETSFWCPLPRLLEGSRHAQQNFIYRGEERDHPVVRVLDKEQPVLWGITYRLLRNFFGICDIEFGSQELFRS